METSGINWIQITDLVVSYGDRVVLSIPSLHFDAGLVYMVVGHMGSGKSTLLTTIAGLKKYRGSVLFSRDVESRDIGISLQQPSDMFFMSTVWDEVCVGVRRYGLPETLCQDVLMRFRIPQDLWYQDPFCLSGSEARRVALAAAFAHNPSVILMDEPTAGMDHSVVSTVLNFAREMANAGKVVIMVTHSPEESMMADRLVVMKNGWIVYVGNPEEFWSDTERVVSAGLLPPEGILWRRFVNASR